MSRELELEKVLADCNANNFSDQCEALYCGRQDGDDYIYLSGTFSLGELHRIILAIDDRSK